jgi:hypothetical protein
LKRKIIENNINNGAVNPLIKLFILFELYTSEIKTINIYRAVILISNLISLEIVIFLILKIRYIIDIISPT